MKLVQFIYPMFLVALGLHAAVLFIPIGETSEEVIEEVDLADLSETKAPTEPFLDPLPVPDLNIPAAEPAKIARSGANRSPQPATNSANARATRPAVTTIARSAPSSQPIAPPAPPSTNSPPPVNSTNLPALPSDSDQSSEERAPAPRNTGTSAENSAQSPARDLIASAAVEPPPSLRSMLNQVAAALTYREEGTGKAAANQRREAWLAKIRTQADVDTIDTIAPTQVPELTRISYPIHSAKDASVLSYSACLEKEPHSAEVGILFDSQGNVASEPELIRSTGYGALNGEILATFASADIFSNQGEALSLENRRSQAYTFEIAVNYNTDTCVSLEKLQPAPADSGG